MTPVLLTYETKDAKAAHDACRVLDENNVRFTNSDTTKIVVLVGEDEVKLINYMLKDFAELVSPSFQEDA